MHFHDLSIYEYNLPGAYEEAYCGLPVRNVGWLSKDHPFPTGELPDEFAPRLLELCVSQLWQNPGLHCMGFHNCEFCSKPMHSGSVEVPGGGYICLGSDELRVLSKDCAYAAPNLIHHYVTAHQYRPPDDFIAAVLNTTRGKDRAREMYVYHLWEAMLNPRVQHDFTYIRAYTGYLPGTLAGTSLGPLVRRYRRAQAAMLAGAALMLLVLTPAARLFGLGQDALGVGALLGFALMVVAAHWFERLPCPFCDAPLSIMKEPKLSMRPPQWHDRLQFSTWLYCAKAHYAFAFRLSPFPWSAPPCHVWFQ